MSDELHTHSINVVERCLEDCRVFAETCLLQIATGRDDAAHVVALKTCRDVIDICRLWLSLSARPDALQGQLCRVCADLCRRCATACSQLSNDYPAMTCASSCQELARCFEQLALRHLQTEQERQAG